MRRGQTRYNGTADRMVGSFQGLLDILGALAMVSPGILLLCPGPPNKPRLCRAIGAFLRTNRRVGFGGSCIERALSNPTLTGQNHLGLRTKLNMLQESEQLTRIIVYMTLYAKTLGTMVY